MSQRWNPKVVWCWNDLSIALPCSWKGMPWLGGGCSVHTQLQPVNLVTTKPYRGHFYLSLTPGIFFLERTPLNQCWLFDCGDLLLSSLKLQKSICTSADCKSRRSAIMNSYGGCIKIAGLRLSSSFFFLEEKHQHCSFLTSTPSPRIISQH